MNDVTAGSVWPPIVRAAIAVPAEILRKSIPNCVIPGSTIAGPVSFCSFARDVGALQNFCRGLFDSVDAYLITPGVECTLSGKEVSAVRSVEAVIEAYSNYGACCNPMSSTPCSKCAPEFGNRVGMATRVTDCRCDAA